MDSIKNLHIREYLGSRPKSANSWFSQDSLSQKPSLLSVDTRIMPGYNYSCTNECRYCINRIYSHIIVDEMEPKGGHAGRKTSQQILFKLLNIFSKKSTWILHECKHNICLFSKSRYIRVSIYLSPYRYLELCSTFQVSYLSKYSVWVHNTNRHSRLFCTWRIYIFS